MHHNIGTVTIEPPTIDPPTIEPPTINLREFTLGSIVALEPLNLATIDPRQLILYIFPVQKLRLTSYCRKIIFFSELSETLSKK